MKGSFNWFLELHRLLGQEVCVLVSLNQIMGSVPRESGSRMIVTATAIHGSIGGGNLEFTAISKARECLREGNAPLQLLQQFGLGPAMNQCCGGAVSLLFERLPAGEADWLNELVAAREASVPVVLVTAMDSDTPRHWVITTQNSQSAALPEALGRSAQELLNNTHQAATNPGHNSQLTLQHESEDWWLERFSDQLQHVFLFGAGHVGQEVAQRIRGLPFQLSWIDQRPEIFPADAAEFATLISSDPIAAVAEAGAGTVFVVMSHSHQLDEDICHAILSRNDPDWDFRWLGLIGSSTKRKRFVHRLQQRGISEEQLQRLTCPIGLAGIRGKQPATIALSLVAQLMMAPK